MDKIEDIRIEPCTKSKYVQPFRVLFKQVTNYAGSYHTIKLVKLFCSPAQNGRDTLWDCVKTHNRYKTESMAHVIPYPPT